ncbi:MAG: IS607 family transposase [Sutterella sp.]|nr:IS607 family transposase [Sutterella sp.]
MHQQNLLSVGQVAKLLGVCTKTIRRWCQSGKLRETLRTVGGHRRFNLSSLERFLPKSTDQRKVVGYARVSSHDQKSDLVTQIERLRNLGCDEVLSDLGSGLNCKKPGLKKLLSKIFYQEVKTLVLLHHDRLLRFGTELVYWLCHKTGTDVWVVEQREDTPFEEELVKDVLTLMTVFCARLYGKRSRRKGLSS